MNTKIFQKILLLIALIMPLVILFANFWQIPPSLSSTDGQGSLALYYDLMHGSMIVLFCILFGKYEENFFIWLALGLLGILAADMYGYYMLHVILTVGTMLAAMVCMIYLNFKNRSEWIFAGIIMSVLGAISYITQFLPFYLFEWLFMGVIGFQLSTLLDKPDLYFKKNR